MKRICKILVVVLLAFFVITGCNDNNDNNGETNTDETVDYNKNIDVINLGQYDGEFGLRFGIIKVTNNNTEPLYVDVNYELYNSNKELIHTRYQLVRIDSGKSAYSIVRQDPEEDKFSSFSYKVEVSNEKINNYNETYNYVHARGRDDGTKIIATFTNESVRTTNVYGLVLFYKNGKIVEALEATCYNLMPTGVRDVEVEYPHQLSFDRYEVIVNEVGTEL